MKTIPSIDIMNSKRVEMVGHVVEKIFDNPDPVEIALSWEKQGVHMIHLVDIDAALNTGRSNIDVIRRTISSLRIPVQVAGGIRSRSQAEGLLLIGASRIVVRPRPCSMTVAKDFAGFDKMVLGVDYLGGNFLRDTGKEGVMISQEKVVSWVSEINESTSLKGILFTDVEKEGSLTGLRNETLRFLSLLRETGLELMYAGGVSSLEDVSTLKKTGVDSIIIGKALYNGLLSLDDLRRVAED